MSKRTNVDIKDAAWIHIVRNFQHPTSRPTTRSIKTIMITTPKKNFWPSRPADMANRHSGPPNDFIKQIKTRAPWRQRESAPFGTAQSEI
jgi:hypothetical protein